MSSNLDELGCQFGVNLLETHFIAEPVLIVFVHFKAVGGSSVHVKSGSFVHVRRWSSVHVTFV